MNKLPVWNLRDFYTNIDSKKINIDLKLIEKNSILFNKKYKSKLRSMKANLLEKSLIEYESIEEKMQFISSFAFLSYCTDQINSKKTKFFLNV